MCTKKKKKKNLVCAILCIIFLKKVVTEQYDMGIILSGMDGVVPLKFFLRTILFVCI